MKLIRNQKKMSKFVLCVIWTNLMESQSTEFEQAEKLRAARRILGAIFPLLVCATKNECMDLQKLRK